MFDYPEVPDVDLDDLCKRIGEFPLLTREEEHDLVDALQRGDEAARLRVLQANVRLISEIAGTYSKSRLPRSVLIRWGAGGLMLAAERFNSERGFRFSTYATHWIRQAMAQAIDFERNKPSEGE